jgi:hypothetical protein
MLMPMQGPRTCNNQRLNPLTDWSLNKSADGTFPARLLGKFMPLGERRQELEPEEQQALERAGRQWIQPVIETDSTPITDLVTSPLRQGVLEALPAALLGGSAGYGFGSLTGHFLPRMAATAAGAGLLGTLGFAHRAILTHRRNSKIQELVRRLPPGSTLRDLGLEQLLERSMLRRFNPQESDHARLSSFNNAPGLLTNRKQAQDDAPQPVGGQRRAQEPRGHILSLAENRLEPAKGPEITGPQTTIAGQAARGAEPPCPSQARRATNCGMGTGTFRCYGALANR